MSAPGDTEKIRQSVCSHRALVFWGEGRWRKVLNQQMKEKERLREKVQVPVSAMNKIKWINAMERLSAFNQNRAWPLFSIKGQSKYLRLVGL